MFLLILFFSFQFENLMDDVSKLIYQTFLMEFMHVGTSQMPLYNPMWSYLLHLVIQCSSGSDFKICSLRPCGNGLSEWEKTSHFYVFSHWLKLLSYHLTLRIKMCLDQKWCEHQFPYKIGSHLLYIKFQKYMGKKLCIWFKVKKHKKHYWRCSLQCIEYVIFVVTNHFLNSLSVILKV